MRTTALWPIVLAAVLFMMTACWGGDEDDGDASSPTPAPTESPEPTGSVPSSPTPEATEPAPTPTPEATATPDEGDDETIAYTVQRGDTLFSLARSYGTTVEVLQELNGIDDPGELRTGSVIRIPRGTRTPTPGATATPAPGGPSQRIDHGPRSGNRVALTFDMGGRVDPAVDIMNWLIANDVQATIFMTGAITDHETHDDGRRVLQLVDQHRNLFELGNHSYSHPDFTTIGDDEVFEELSSTEESIARHTSLPMRPLFRPPFGAVDDRVLRLLGEAGYPYTVMWDIDSGDWRPISDGGPTAEEMADKVVSNAQGGTIVVLHLGGYETLEALPAMVDGLKDRGFEMVKVSALLP